MRKKTTRYASISLFAALLASAGALLYTQTHDLLLPGLLFVVLLFGVCMGLLWVSESEHTEEGSGKEHTDRRRMRDHG